MLMMPKEYQKLLLGNLCEGGGASFILVDTYAAVWLGVVDQPVRDDGCPVACEITDGESKEETDVLVELNEAELVPEIMTSSHDSLSTDSTKLAVQVKFTAPILSHTALLGQRKHSIWLGNG